MALKLKRFSPKVDTVPNGPDVISSSSPFIKQVVTTQVPSVEAEAHTLALYGSNLTQTADDL